VWTSIEDEERERGILGRVAIKKGSRHTERGLSLRPEAGLTGETQEPSEGST